MVISVEQAYAAGPDGSVDTSAGSPFRQYMAQQDIYKANVGPGSAIANSLSGGQNYLANNVDVFTNAQERAQSEGLSGNAYANRLDEIAREHYDLYGRAEGRAGFGNAPAPLMDGAASTFPGTNINPGNGQPFTPAPGQIGLGSSNGQSQQSTFDNSGYQTALNNFGGLLNNYGDFFGGLLSGAQNGQDQSNMNPYSAYPNANYVNPWNATAPMGVNSVFGANNSMSGLGNLAGGVASGGWNSGSSWNGGGGAANTGHNMLWTT